MIGLKTSRHSGQQFLTFKRPRIVYEYTIGGQPYTPKSGQSIKAYIGEYADYGDFLNFSDTVSGTSIDPVVKDTAKKMGENFAAKLDKTLTRIWFFGIWPVPKGHAVNDHD